MIIERQLLNPKTGFDDDINFVVNKWIQSPPRGELESK